MVKNMHVYCKHYVTIIDLFLNKLYCDVLWVIHEGLNGGPEFDIQSNNWCLFVIR